MKCPKCQTDNPDTQRFCGECATSLPSPKDIAVTKTLETSIEELTTGSTFAGRLSKNFALVRKSPGAWNLLY